jgi:ketosteroid isomerase-like protein
MSEFTPRQRENLEAVRRGYDRYNADDIEGQIDNCDEEIEVYMPLEAGPTPGTYRGHDGYRQWYHDWKESFEDYKAEPLKIEPIGERHVVALARQTAKGKGSGVPVQMDSGNMFEVRDGKLLALHLYLSHEQALEAAKRRETEAPDDR